MDCFADGGLRRHHRLHVEAGHKLDIVHREDVGRIGHRDRERRSHARKRHNLIADCGFLRDKLDNGWIDFVELQIDRRDAVLPGKHCGDVFIAYNSHLDEARAQPAPVLFLIVEGLLELIRGDQAVFDENFAES